MPHYTPQSKAMHSNHHSFSYVSAITALNGLIRICMCSTSRAQRRVAGGERRREKKKSNHLISHFHIQDGRSPRSHFTGIQITSTPLRGMIEGINGRHQTLTGRVTCTTGKPITKLLRQLQRHTNTRFDMIFMGCCPISLTLSLSLF